MKFELLISCMFQDIERFIDRANIVSNARIINQCDDIAHTCYRAKNGIVNIYCTNERGLSKSRNMAIRLSDADVVLIADDDEVFDSNCAKNIIEAFETNPEYSVITFNIHNLKKANSNIEYRIGYVEAMKTSSVQIAFKLKDIKNHGIRFQENMGSGTGNGAMEEIKFLFDCLKTGLKIKHIPVYVATLNPDSISIWNKKPFSNQYFRNRGWASKQYLGSVIAILYALEFCACKYFKYRKISSFCNALIQHILGIRSKR